jgi:hypothetical protein
MGYNLPWTQLPNKLFLNQAIAWVTSSEDVDQYLLPMVYMTRIDQHLSLRLVDKGRIMFTSLQDMLPT